MRDFIFGCNAWQIAVLGVMFFAAIYTLFGTINSLLTRKILPWLNIGKPLDSRPVSRDQLRRELLWSASSIMIFGVGLIIPWGILQLGWARLAVQPSALQIVVECLVLLLWNEVHFYANHWLLHRRRLRRFHSAHHRSVVTTPWSTYAFHPLEAALLGSVLIVPMLVHNFSIYALAFLPMASLLINSIGHSNYDWNPARNSVFYNASRRHHLHHARYNGNYGFMLPFMDQLFHTVLPLEQRPGAQQVKE